MSDDTQVFARSDNINSTILKFGGADNLKIVILDEFSIPLSHGRFENRRSTKSRNAVGTVGLVVASVNDDPQAAPQGLLCLRITAAGLSIRYFMLSPLSTSVRLILPDVFQPAAYLFHRYA